MGGTSGGAGGAKAPPLFLNEGHNLTTFSRSIAHAHVCCHSQWNTHVLTAVGTTNFLMLLYIHKDKTIDLRAAMTEFIEKNTERRHIYIYYIMYVKMIAFLSRDS